MVWFGRLEIDGGSGRGLTERVNVRSKVLFVVPSSMAVTVIMALPCAFSTGTNVRKPLVSGLVNRTTGSGIINGSLDVADMVTV